MEKALSFSFQNAKRLQQIVNTVFKYGFGYILTRIGVVKFIPKIKTVDEKIGTPVRVRLMLEELGPTFVKLGQILSMRPDLLPEDYIMELKKLQDEVPGVDFPYIKSLIESELGKKLEDIFDYFEEQPKAAASIAQVHRARLKSKEEVVVKVQRPDIEKIINSDLEIMFHAARLLERYVPESRLYDPVGIVEEFSEEIKNELDFLREGWNVERFRKNFKGDDSVYVPKVYWEYTTKKILVMEYIDGIKIKDIKSIEEHGFSKKELAEKGIRAVLKQVFKHGFFHADPHGGNIILTKDGRIAFIDFGIMGRLDNFYKYKLLELIQGAISKNIDKVCDVLLEIGFIEGKIDYSRLRWDVEDVIERFYGKTLKEINMSEMLPQMLKLSQKHRVKVPSNLILLIKAVITAEGLGKELYPDFDIVSVAKPYVYELIISNYSPERVIKNAGEELRKFQKAIKGIPEIINKLNNKLAEDNIKIDFEYRGLEKFAFELSKMVNRLVIGIIVSAIIVASSLIIRANVGPMIFGISAIGMLGYMLAAFFGFMILISILRTG